ncbi:MAG: hypothetical protein NOU37_03380 [Candidatus Brocadiales bacterium]|nr:hypothetical protein [Candidatus Bathyanammoxibius amoris]
MEYEDKKQSISPGGWFGQQFKKKAAKGYATGAAAQQRIPIR